MKSVHPLYPLRSVPVLPGFPSAREVWEDRGLPIFVGLPEALSWRDASHVISAPR